MGVSEGTFQVEEFAKGDGVATGAGPFEKVAGMRYHPFSLRTILWHRKKVDPVDLFVEIVSGDQVYEVDKLAGTVLKNYHWPNATSPEKFDLVPPQRVRFRVAGTVDVTEVQSVEITCAELGAP